MAPLAPVPPEPPSTPPPAPVSAYAPRAPGRAQPAAERRHLTVLVCEPVESLALAGQLDPEDYWEVVRAYQDTWATVLQGFEGHIAQARGEGPVVYFGYPQAHEDDAQRAVRLGRRRRRPWSHSSVAWRLTLGRGWPCGWASTRAWWSWAQGRAVYRMSSWPSGPHLTWLQICRAGGARYSRD